MTTIEELANKALAKNPEDRTYADRYYIWKYDRLKTGINPYDEGEEIEIYDGTKLANNEIKDGFGCDFPEWFRECGKHFGERVKLKHSKEVQTLIGMSYTYVDCYYILESNNSKIYTSCVESIEFLGY